MSEAIRASSAPVRLLLYAAPLFTAGEALAQDTGFLTERGRTSVALSYARDTIDEYRLGTMHASLSGDIVRESVSFWAAHGWTDDLEAWLSAAWVSQEADASLGVEDERGLQDMALGLRWRCLRSEGRASTLSVLLAPALQLPLSDYDTRSVTAIGDGQVDVLGRLVVQLLFDAGPFLALETGYDARLGDPEDEIPLNLSAGLTLLERLTVTAWYARVESLGGTTLGSVSSGGSFAGLEQDRQEVGLGGYLRLADDLGLTAGFRRSFDGSNTGLGSGVFVGLVLSL